MSAAAPVPLPADPDLPRRLAELPTGAGCYIYKDAHGQEIYVGKAKNLRARVGSYFHAGAGHPIKTVRMLEEACDLEIIEVDSEVEALLLENRLIKDLQPAYNVRLKDDKTYPLLAIGREPYPRVHITRDRDLPVDYLGPFVAAGSLHQAYHFLMRAFRFRSCKREITAEAIRSRRYRPCLNYHIERCSGPCAGRISQEHYAADIRALRDFLTGRRKGQVMRDLRRRMQAASEAQEYEEAARCRDQLKALDDLGLRGRLSDYTAPAAPIIEAEKSLARLARILDLPDAPRVIEGFDIAHLAGQHVVASMVRFLDGVPHRQDYRRYRIRGPEDTGPSNDDVAAMAEVVGRRYRRLRDERRPLPDLILVDGGHAQVAAAHRVLAELDLTVPALIGLAKREETVVAEDGREHAPGRRDPGLKLLMYIRDEAHRFCRRYYHLLQRKGLTGEDPAASGRLRRR